MPQDYLDYQETSQLLKVPVGTLYSWVSQRKIPHVRITERTIRFRREDLEQWLDERRVGAQ